MSEWKAIESAPRDGTWIWAYLPPVSVPVRGKGKKPRRNKLGGRQKAIKWVCPEQDTFPGGAHLTDHAKRLRAEQGGYWTTGGQGRKPSDGAPSHWMPLPSPPETPHG